jgi:hypothetical protein
MSSAEMKKFLTRTKKVNQLDPFAILRRMDLSPTTITSSTAQPLQLVLPFVFIDRRRIPFVQDGLRHREHIRHEMHTVVRTGARRAACATETFCRCHENRLREASLPILNLFKHSAWRPKLLIST